MALLEVSDLTVSFYTPEGVVTAVDDLSYTIERGETFGVVGESGAGKSVAALALLDLIDAPGRIERGEVRLDGEDILQLPDEELRRVRGNRIAMIFQDAQAALNPVYTVGEQIAEGIRHHLEYDREAARTRAIELLERVGIPNAERRYHEYPHEFSGGMQQRVVIAMALSCDPDLVIADEPTTALDVTTEAQTLELLEDLADEFDTAIQLITHDLGVVAERCDRVLVMYAGQAVETAPVEELYYDPKHPYTVGLLSSIPRVGDDRDRLRTIPGAMPDPIDPPTGCRFHPRCPYAEEICRRKAPPLTDPDSEADTSTSPDSEGGASTNPDSAATPDSAETLDSPPRAARCLEYTGDLEDGLDFEVSIEGEPADETTDHGRSNEEKRDEREPGDRRA